MDTKRTPAGRLIFSMTEEEYRAASEDSGGFCLSCGADACGVEPDARKYKCEACGENRVYGIEELLLMGRIEIAE
jgi:hypothetical protein